MKIYIYKIYFPISNKCYIGQTSNLEKRLFEHIESKYLIGIILNKYDDWQISVLHICSSKEEANRLEIEEIRNYNSKIPNGYNMTNGGDGGNTGNYNSIKFLESVKKNCRKMIERNKGLKRSIEFKNNRSNKYSGIGNPMYGKKRPDVSKRNRENKYASGMKRPSNKIRNQNYIIKLKQQISRYKTYIKKLEREI